MTPEEQRVAIAEACGWEGHAPDYLKDLNAIIVAIRERILGDADLERAFIKHLNSIIDRRADADDGPVICEYEMAQITAAPDEFCEAFLQTLKKWKCP